MSVWTTCWQITISGSFLLVQEDAKIGTFILAVEPVDKLHAIDELNQLLASVGQRSLRLIEQVWIIQSVSTLSELKAVMFDLLYPRNRFVLVKTTLIATLGLRDSDQALFDSLDLTLAAPDVQSEDRAYVDSSLDAKPTAHNDVSIAAHLVSVEEELARVCSKFGFTDRARELLFKSPLRK